MAQAAEKLRAVERPRMRAASITLKEITKVFRGRGGTEAFKALDKASCSVAAGEFVCVLGPFVAGNRRC